MAMDYTRGGGVIGIPGKFDGGLGAETGIMYLPQKGYIISTYAPIAAD